MFSDKHVPSNSQKLSTTYIFLCKRIQLILASMIVLKKKKTGFQSQA